MDLESFIIELEQPHIALKWDKEKEGHFLGITLKLKDHKLENVEIELQSDLFEKSVLVNVNIIITENKSNIEGKIYPYTSKEVILKGVNRNCTYEFTFFINTERKTKVILSQSNDIVQE